MRGLDLFTPRQISDRPCQFQDAATGTRRQIHLARRHPHQTLTIILQFAKLPYLPNAHISVRNDI
jgi:hypothetical protein